MLLINSNARRLDKLGDRSKDGGLIVATGPRFSSESGDPAIGR